ncbi:MAG TPA: hypothetical protein VGJ97_11710 [Anaerolineaceae bacterium]|jgi:hypothetical protein
MSQSLSAIRDRVGQILQDPTGLVFDSATLDGSIRSAVADLALAKGALQTVTGLDGEVTTSFSDLEANVVESGAAAYAVLGRVIRRSESFNLKQSVPLEIRQWADTRMQDFQRMLEQIRCGTFHAAAVIPWPARGWGMDEWDVNAGREP